jgi:hypothetical protein
VAAGLLQALTDAHPYVPWRAAESLELMNTATGVVAASVKLETVRPHPVQAALSPSSGEKLARPSSLLTESETLVIRVMEEPLTAQDLVRTLSGLTRLHTTCWLMAQGRFNELIQYSQTHDPRLEEEAHLVIEEMRHNSPLEVKLDPGLKAVAEALQIAIDGLAQAKQRHRDAMLKNEALAAEIRQKEQQVQAALTDQKQARRVAAEKAELERKQTEQMLQLEKEKAELEQQQTEVAYQKALLDLQIQQVELLKAQVELQKAQLAFEVERVNQALELAAKMVDRLQPGAEPAVRTMLMQTLLPDLLQLGSATGLQLVASLPKPGESAEGLPPVDPPKQV